MARHTHIDHIVMMPVESVGNTDEFPESFVDEPFDLDEGPDNSDEDDDG